MLQNCSFPSKGFSGGIQSSVAGDSQLPFRGPSQTHLRSGREGMGSTCIMCIYLTGSKLAESVILHKS